MKALSVCIALVCIGFILYSLMLFTYGESGLQVYREREAYRAELLQNIDRLQVQNTLLQSELSALRTSTEQKRLAARHLGYYASNEYPVFGSFNLSRKSYIDTGNVIMVKQNVQPLANNRLASYFWGAGGFLIPGFLLFRQGRKKNS